MIKILFVCHGNICRSPMAEFVMKDMVKKAGYRAASARDQYAGSADFIIDSAATSREEIGCGVHRGTRRKLAEVGIPCGDHRARQVTKQDYEDYDLLIIMDKENLLGIRRIIPDDPEGKIHMLMEYTGKTRDVADPWYTGNFDVAYEDIIRGCRALLQKIILQKII